ncbi:hypothetical protein CR513_51155, partial [Mucuna pruriens]
MVKKEVTKLLTVGIIYPISNSQWVSPMQVVPKKFGMMVMKNHWRVCTNYRKLNQATRKDHFPLPFIDQVLEKLVGKSHYYFLDGFSGYMQIHIAPKDQHKTTFTCPFGTFVYIRMPFGLCNAPKIRDKKGAENSITDHLSQIERESDPTPIRDEFLDEQLLHINTPTPWFIDIYNFVATSQFPPKAS